MFLHLKEEYGFDSLLSSKVGWFINSYLFTCSHNFSFSFSPTRSRTSSRSWGPWAEPATTRTSASWQTGSGSSASPGPYYFSLWHLQPIESTFTINFTSSRSDNIASLLSNSTKYAFAGIRDEQTETDTEFSCDLDAVVNLPGVQAVSAFDEDIDLEATTYVAGFITHKVRHCVFELISFSHFWHTNISFCLIDKITLFSHLR